MRQNLSIVSASCCSHGDSYSVPATDLEGAFSPTSIFRFILCFLLYLQSINTFSPVAQVQAANSNTRYFIFAFPSGPKPIPVFSQQSYGIANSLPVQLSGSVPLLSKVKDIYRDFCDSLT